MTWATAAGLGGVSVAVIALVIGFLTMLKAAYEHGVAENTAHLGQLDAEFFKREAEKERDAEKALRVKAEGDLAEITKAHMALVARFSATEAELLALRTKDINHAQGDDLLAVSHGVLGPHVPTSSGASGTSDEGGAAGASSLPSAGPASGR